MQAVHNMSDACNGTAWYACPHSLCWQVFCYRPEGVLTFCVLLLELQQQALLEGHVVLAGTYQSFGLGLMRADLQVCIYKAAPKLPRGTYWQTHFSIGILGMLVHENAPEAIWLGISAAACCVVCSSIYTVGPEQQNHSGSCACSFNPSKFGLSKAVWADVPAVTVVRASAA